MENNQNTPVRRPFNIQTLIIGLLVIGIGLLWLLRNTGYLQESTWDIIFSWEMLLIAIGLVTLFGEKGKLFGFLLIAVGAFFLLSHHFDLPFTFRRVFWPAILILLGLFLLFGSRRVFRRQPLSSSTDVSNLIDEVSIFGGHEKRFKSDNFMGGQVVSIFGGSKIDLTDCKLAKNAQLEITAIFGGSELFIPDDWNVRLEIVNIFGGYGDKRRKGEIDMEKTLVIKGVAVFGGGEIKSL
jgi:predicted membrane protein